jgi:hypothetical protein
MSRIFKIGMVGLLVIGALAAVMTGSVLAQDEGETPTPEEKPFDWHGRGRGFDYGFSRGMGGQLGLEAAAEALGMTADELFAQLWGGKTLADLAEEKGVDLQDVQDAVRAAGEAAFRDAIQQAVEDGTLDEGHAAWLLEGLENGYLGGRGFGGFGGCHGRGGFGGRGSFGRFSGGNTGFSGFGRFPGRNVLTTETTDL